MKKSLLILTVIGFASTLINAQIVNIPDANFKAYLVGNTAINTNGNTEIEVTEATNYTGGIYCSNKNISDLTGIEAFTKITNLGCTGNSLTTLNLSSNTALTNLTCFNNSLSNLDLSTNTALYHLDFVNNSLTSIDLSNNTALSLLRCYGNSLNSLDLSQNINLTTLECYNNPLNNLDLSNNTALSWLRCANTSLNSLDLTFNTALTLLNCNDNSLTSLDLSNNTALQYLDCNRDSLTSLDLSSNTALTNLSCVDNSLIHLDLSYNTALRVLKCNDNSLSGLNIANGNNSNLHVGTFSIKNNPNLFCIQVDDPIFMYNSFADSSQKDVQAQYGANCFYHSEHNIVSGSIFLDQDSNCIGEGYLHKNIFIKDTRGYYAHVDSNGNYRLRTDTGIAYIEQIFANPLISQTCFNGGYSISFDTFGVDSSGFNFYNTLIDCPKLNVDIMCNRRRRCFKNQTYINYSNDGYVAESNVQLVVEFPEYVHLVSTNRLYTIDGAGRYVFDIGSLAAGEAGQLNIIDSVACENNISGLTQCTRVWITPSNECLNNLDSAILEWDKSSISVTGTCMNDSIKFVIYNTGDAGNGDMDGTSQYRIYVDNLLSYTGMFQLNGEDSLLIQLPANGQTIRIEADQRFGHPGSSRPRTTIEACGNGGVPIEYGMPLQSELDNLDYEVAEHCLPIIDSYDPNDKKVFPQGTTVNRYVHPDSKLNYTIRFQNTGTDTAYTVIIVDSLSKELDLANLKLGASSHPYNFEIRSGSNGQPVLMFIFHQINLVDSLTDETNSNGFVSFTIKSNNGTTNNTVVHNSADIYFDYNLPITTNDSWITISDTVIYGPNIVVTETKNTSIAALTNQKLNIFPNPFNEFITLTLSDGLTGNESVQIYDLVGKEFFSTNINNKASIRIDGAMLEKGVYFIELRSDSGIILGRSKVVKQ